MYVPRKAVLAVFVSVLVAGSLVFAFAASSSSRDEGNGDALFASTLAPSVPTDPAFHGIRRAACRGCSTARASA